MYFVPVEIFLQAHTKDMHDRTDCYTFMMINYNKVFYAGNRLTKTTIKEI